MKHEYSPAAGRYIAVGEPIEVAPRKPPKRKFKAQFVQVPIYWVNQLKLARRRETYVLAHEVLRQAFMRAHTGGGEIILSTDQTGMVRQARQRATAELVRLGLIEVAQNGNAAVRVTRLNKEASPTGDVK
jgi:hypothetical protein